MQQLAKKRNDIINVDGIFPEILEIEDKELADATRATWQEIWSLSHWDDVEKIMVSPEIKYPNRPHSQCVVAMALQIADSFEKFHGVKVNRDYLISAAILQDASKVIEYEPDEDGATRISKSGRMYPHAFMAAQIGIKHNLPEEVIHAIIFHTPQAAKFPATIEGKILYYVDQLDVIAIHGDRWRKDLYITK